MIQRKVRYGPNGGYARDARDSIHQIPEVGIQDQGVLTHGLRQGDLGGQDPVGWESHIRGQSVVQAPNHHAGASYEDYPQGDFGYDEGLSPSDCAFPEAIRSAISALTMRSKICMG